MTEKTIRVLQSSAPGPTTNPYITQLFSQVPSTVQLPFSWRLALFGRWDVFHIHLIEVLFVRRSRLKTVIGAGLLLLVLVRCRIARRGIVRTVHNLAPHERQAIIVDGVTRLSDRWTDVWIVLNPYTPVPTEAPSVLIPHSDYREWFAPFEHPASDLDRVLYFGLIRPYKGIDALVDAFARITGPHLRLHIVGRPQSAGLLEELRARISTDARVSVTPTYVDDAALSVEIGQSCLVVLPYREMHNSGSAILALSLSRPVLLPRTDTNLLLLDEIGSDWIRLYDDDLDADDVRTALEWARSRRPDSEPDLSGRSWAMARSAHADAYRLAAARARQIPGLRPYSK